MVLMVCGGVLASQSCIRREGSPVQLAPLTYPLTYPTRPARPHSRPSSADGDTPLFCACIEGHDACVNELLGRGADVDIINHNGATALMCAVLSPASPGICDLPSSTDEGVEQRLRILRQLLGRVPTLIDRQDRGGSTALHIAACCAQPRFVEVLVRGSQKSPGMAAVPGANITIRNVAGQTALQESESLSANANTDPSVKMLREQWQKLEEDAAGRMESLLLMEDDAPTRRGASGGGGGKNKKKKKKKKKKGGGSGAGGGGVGGSACGGGGAAAATAVEAGVSSSPVKAVEAVEAVETVDTVDDDCETASDEGQSGTDGVGNQEEEQWEQVHSSKRATRAAVKGGTSSSKGARSATGATAGGNGATGAAGAAGAATTGDGEKATTLSSAATKAVPTRRGEQQ